MRLAGMLPLATLNNRTKWRVPSAKMATCGGSERDDHMVTPSAASSSYPPLRRGSSVGMAFVTLPFVYVLCISEITRKICIRFRFQDRPMKC